MIVSLSLHTYLTKMLLHLSEKADEALVLSNLAGLEESLGAADVRPGNLVHDEARLAPCSTPFLTRYRNTCRFRRPPKYVLLSYIELSDNITLAQQLMDYKPSDSDSSTASC